MDLTSLIVQAVGGAAGGTAGGKFIKGGDMGQIGNLIAGAVGGVAAPFLADCWVRPAATQAAEWTSAPLQANSSAAVLADLSCRPLSA